MSAQLPLHQIPTGVDSIVERLDIGTVLAVRTIGDRVPHMPVGHHVKALAQGVMAWRDLMEGVLAGDVEATAIAVKAIGRHPWPQPKPTEGGTKS